MPDTTMTTRTGMDTRQVVTTDTEIEKAVQAGDVDAVLDGIMKRALA